MVASADGTEGGTMSGNTRERRAGILWLLILALVLTAAFAAPAAARPAQGGAPGSLAATDSSVITASATGPGKISPSGQVPVPYSADATFTITPDAHSHVQDVLVDGQSVGAVTSYTFHKVVANHAIAATFAADPVITASAGPGGTISPSGDVSVSYLGSQTFTISPSAGYHVADVVVDGQSVGAVTKYTFTRVTASHIIKASFAPDAYVIHASAGAHGVISPSGDVSVPAGGSQIFEIAPDQGYEVADVVVDGQSVGAVATYTFEKVVASHTIAASFAAQPALRLSPFLTPGLVVGMGFDKQVLFTVRTAAAASALPGPSAAARRATPPGTFIVNVLAPGSSTPSPLTITWSLLPDGSSAAKGTLPSETPGDYHMTIEYKGGTGAPVVETVDYKVSGYYAPLEGLPNAKSVDLGTGWPAKKAFPLRLKIRTSKGGPALKAKPRLYVYDLTTGVRVYRAKAYFKSLGGGKYAFSWIPRQMTPFVAWRGTWRQVQIVVPHYVKGALKGEKTLGTLKVKWW
jgi:hypothetical protein